MKEQTVEQICESMDKQAILGITPKPSDITPQLIQELSEMSLPSDIRSKHIDAENKDKKVQDVLNHLMLKQNKINMDSKDMRGKTYPEMLDYKITQLRGLVSELFHLISKETTMDTNQMEKQLNANLDSIAKTAKESASDEADLYNYMSGYNSRDQAQGEN